MLEKQFEIEAIRIVIRMGTRYTHAVTVMARLKYFLLFVSVITGIGIGEIAIRRLNAAPEVVPVSKGRYRLSEDPVLIYEPVPLEHHGELSTFFDFEGKSNRLGFRDRDHDVNKPAGVFRILILGDSIAAGTYIREEKDIFPVLLEQRLKQRYKNIEILNFAVPGYNTRQEVEMLAVKGLAYQPDIVLVAYCLNDITHVDGGIVEGLLRDADQTFISHLEGRFLIHSALYRFFRYRVFRPSSRKTVLERYDYLDTLKENTVPESFDRLGVIARRNGFSVIVAVFPNFRQLKPYPFLDEHEKVHRLAEKNGFHFIDLLEAFQMCAEKTGKRLDFDYIHPNITGHRCAAEALAKYIESEFKDQLSSMVSRRGM